MKICDICKKEEARDSNARFGEDYCDTCANKLYNFTQDLKAQYAKEQEAQPITTAAIVRLKPFGPLQEATPDQEPAVEPKNHTVELSENLGVSDERIN